MKSTPFTKLEATYLLRDKEDLRSVANVVELLSDAPNETSLFSYINSLPTLRSFPPPYICFFNSHPSSPWIPLGFSSFSVYLLNSRARRRRALQCSGSTWQRRHVRRVGGSQGCVDAGADVCGLRPLVIDSVHAVEVHYHAWA